MAALSEAPAHWRDQIKVHPACELIPTMSAEDFEALREDIAAHGLLQPIVVWRESDAAEWQLLDGRHRLDALSTLPDGDRRVAEALRLPVRKGPGVDPYEYVASVNLHRRHLTTEQKREVVANLLKQSPQRSDNATAKLARVSDKTVASVRRDLERRSEIPNVSARTDTRGRQQPVTRKPPAAPPSATRQTTVVAYLSPPRPLAEVTSDIADKAHGKAAAELIERFARRAQTIRAESVRDLDLPELMELSIELDHAQAFLSRVAAAVGAAVAKLSSGSRSTANDQPESDTQQLAQEFSPAETPEQAACILPRGCRRYAECGKGWCGAAAAATGPAGRA